MLKAWRAHQAEVQRRAEAGEPPLKTIEDFRVEIPDALPDAPDATEPEAADSTTQNTRTDRLASPVQGQPGGMIILGYRVPSRLARRKRSEHAVIKTFCCHFSDVLVWRCRALACRG